MPDTRPRIQINEEDNPDIEILAVRDIEATNNSNLFTQFSIHTQETNGHDRLIGNVGLGYRILSEDKSNVVGVNLFLDNDFNCLIRSSSHFFLYSYLELNSLNHNN